MSYPFGGHPTFAEYLNEVHNVHEFNAQSGFATTANGRTVSRTRVYKDGGPSVIIVGKKPNDRLEPTYIAQLDRRLGIKCRWNSIDSA
jgi:hypothetical protein